MVIKESAEMYLETILVLSKQGAVRSPLYGCAQRYCYIRARGYDK